MKRQFLLIVSIVLFGASIGSAQNAPVKQISKGVLNGSAITLAKPAYPAAARAVNAEGAVNVQVTIDEEGNVISASAVSGHPLLRQASVQAALSSKFKTTTLAGQAVKVTGVIVYNFISPKPAPTNEEKLGIMGLGVYLTISDFLPNNEWEVMAKEDLREVPQIADQLTPLMLITKTTTKEKRNEIVKKVIASLESKLSGADAWQFEFGKEFGGVMIELQKVSTDAGKSIDETAVKTKLIRMRDLLITAPDDFPQAVLEKLKEFVKFADVQDLNKDENKFRFVQLMTETINTISPDKSK